VSGDCARVSLSVEVPPAFAFEVFTGDIDRWWRRGPKYRNASSSGLIKMEGWLGGRLFESFERDGEPHVFEVGKILVWQPPHRLSFSWRNANYAAAEHTEVEVEFSPTRSGTTVSVVHRRLSTLRADHPARHGLPHDQFLRMIGLWWGEQMSSFRETLPRPADKT
jgi:uncharacterized protein YndB with AHSA1/START domain